MTTLRCTTTPSAELESTTGGRFSSPGLTTGAPTRGIPCGRVIAGREFPRGGGPPTMPEPCTTTAPGAPFADGACACAGGGVIVTDTGACGGGACSTAGACGSTRMAGWPRAAKKAAILASKSPRVSSFITDLCSLCISTRTRSSSAAMSYSCLRVARMVPS